MFSLAVPGQIVVPAMGKGASKGKPRVFAVHGAGTRNSPQGKKRGRESIFFDNLWRFAVPDRVVAE